MSAAERRPTLSHRVEIGAVHALRLAVRGLGRRGGDLLGRALGGLAYRLGIRRDVVLEHLRRAFPDRDERWIARTARASYSHLGREAAIMLRLLDADAGTIRAMTEVEGLDAVRAALDEGNGVVVVTGHLGNWEIGGSALAVRGIPIDGVAQQQSNPLFEALLQQARDRLGMRIIERSRASREALRSLRAGRLVAFVADQDGRGSGVFVPFMGRPASTHRGPALMALRTGAPMFFGSALRTLGGYHVRLVPVEADRSGPTDEAVRRLTAAFTAVLEEQVRRMPGQYFWQHKRWKTRPA
ncbi:MAG TPA: lysophospholipid acyltransferase family protein [Longimicrobiales bacterium]|nr:lysophospholipid acyltransferase family protein [Longimicrobiales bacterium]